MTSSPIQQQFDANGLPLFAPQQPKTFQEFMANPANVQAATAFTAPPMNINPQKPVSFWDKDANFASPAGQATTRGWVDAQRAQRAPALRPNLSQPPLQAPAGTMFGSQPAQLPNPFASNAAPPPAASMPSQFSTPDAALGALGQWAKPNVQGQTQADQAKLATLQNNGAGLNQIKNPFLRTLARVGDVAGTVLSPGLALAVPGTTLHNRLLQHDQQRIVAQDQTNDQLAQNAYQQRFNNQLAQEKLHAQLNQQQANLARYGLMATTDENGNYTVAPDPNSPIIQKMQAQSTYFDARRQYAQAAAALADAKTKNQPLLIQQAQQRLDTAAMNGRTAAQRLGLSEDEFGFNQDKFYNPQPTSQERKTGDLAQSAVNQVHVMRTILNAHPEFFGPGAGRGTKFQQWLGSQSPDAQQYLSASRYLADHSAGVFGSRSVEVTKLLEQLTDPATNPAALNAALNQAESTAQHFVDAGRVHGKPAVGALNTPVSGNLQTLTDGGKTYRIPASQVGAFRKDHPNAR